MAPREAVKPTAKVQSMIKTNTSKIKCSPVSVKNTSSLKKSSTKISSQGTTTKQANSTAATTVPRLRTSTVPKVSTPKPKENKSVPSIVPGSVTKSGKKKPLWKRKPLPAHSGVPMPEKMKKLHLKLLEGGDEMLHS